MSFHSKPFTMGALRNFVNLAAILVLAVAFDMLVRFLVSKKWLVTASFSYDCITGVTMLIEGCDTLLLGAMVVRHTWDGLRAQIWPATDHFSLSQVEGRAHVVMDNPAQAKSPKSPQRAAPISQEYPPDPDIPRATSWGVRILRMVTDLVIHVAAVACLGATVLVFTINGFSPEQAAGASVLVILVTPIMWRYIRWIQQTAHRRRLDALLIRVGGG